ncbi:hypothetical protein SAMN05661008_00989 [Alkalithermobacter thermoalcaliphilus JW-YL-7 = DSM 7308]|uniref:DUF503 domain-containing protein n=1 Tax=Alkalithermobacter thermoalcaliphilus JW-YL-7 = DSM 7308 TaxID=1121328 RepID=A0A150FNU4_CLOPD|nr:protein of unknown function DUF503 [[Clostridium] paradoxum JW-YL-7 = DSM 7308]SHK84327.1 hypothetical protein SAMN05661008_00989 [[Clostridium] paradoxum JW-YL-7 = DSM 7308]
MIIGSCIIEITIYDVSTLKEKRHVVKSIVERLKSRYNISIAEIGMNDKWQRSQIGFACVSNSKNHANEVIDKVINFIENDQRIEITNIEIEIL